jgi:hypothetical protein
MFELMILGTMAVAGYLGGSGWLGLAGAVALTVGRWVPKLRLLRLHPRVPLSTKMIAYFVAGVVANLLLAGAFLLVGRLTRAWFEG